MSRIKKEKRIFVRIQLNEDTFADVAEWAVKSGIRDKSFVLWRKDKNSFTGLGKANTKGLAKYFQSCHKYYKDHAPERAAAEAAIIAEEKALAQKKAKLGF